MNSPKINAGLIWNIAELLRGGWKQHEYQDVILPLTVLRRLDSILSDSKQEVLKTYNSFNGKVEIDPILKSVTKTGFFNISPYDFEKLLDEPKDINNNLRNYISGFSSNIQEIFEKFDFDKQLSRLEGGNLLYLIIKEFNKVDLHPSKVNNHDMGYLFEELIRRFSESSNETAGEHYTPREVIALMVSIMFKQDKEILKNKHIVKTIYDCCCGTGGMLTIAKEFIHENINPDANIYLYGQELNQVTYAIAKSDILIKGEDANKIKGGDKDHSKASTLSNDQFLQEKFDYMLSNPPYGVDWKKDKDAVDSEADRGFAGRFGAGTPRISDGQLLFIQHMISKMRNKSEGGSRIAVVFNGSPLFTGDAGSGESEIRRWILENDYLEAIIALPDQLFYNTGINTYIWFLTNRKEKDRTGKVQLVDARNFYKKMKKSLGNKRNEISEDKDIPKIQELYLDFKENEYSKIFKNTDFGFRQITIERPLRLNFSTTLERLNKVADLGDKLPSNILTILEYIPVKVFNSRNEFIKILDECCKKNDLKLSAGQKKILLGALSERDENAEICFDSDGKPEPDNELKDTENVPYNQDIYKYFEKEVKPFVPDAWINETVRDHKDGKIGKVGYEIPVTRYFYKYTPPRNLEEIENDIEKVENELLDLLKKL